jgi:hypothetical protein
LEYYFNNNWEYIQSTGIRFENYCDRVRIGNDEILYRDLRFKELLPHYLRKAGLGGIIGNIKL